MKALGNILSESLDILPTEAAEELTYAVVASNPIPSNIALFLANGESSTVEWGLLPFTDFKMSGWNRLFPKTWYVHKTLLGST